uniref:BICRA like chromatin remodeling complex associated protein n=1 Tax=Amphilophus citrinellus TaxID=61819 RepID=A0A3Q0RJ37_AMPCI
MDDDDDRRLLDILDVDALNDYLHGSNSKSIEEDDVTNAAYGSDGSLFGNDTAGSNTGLKDGSSTMGEFGEDSAGAGLQLSSSLSFIEDELGPGTSPGGVDLGGEDQPFDILQKSLLEADITEQTLAQEALLDSQPAPTLVQAPVPFSSQLVSGGYGGGVGVVTTAATTFSSGQFLQGMSSLPNGSAQPIQVLGSFGTGGGVMTLSSLERTPQIVLRPGVSVAPAGTTTGGQVFAPTQGQVGQVGLPFKNIPLQNIIIQRGPGGAQTLVRPIQPKPLQTGSQTVYSLGLQPTSATMANVVNANTAAPAGQYTANGSIVVQPPLEQQQAPTLTNIPPGQFLLPSSLALTPSSTIHNGPITPNSNSLITSQNTVQIVAAQNFTTPTVGQLILNQGVILQQLRKDQAAVQIPDRRRFSSVDDTLLRLLPYHVFQGAPPSPDEFSQDEEFEVVATQVLKRTQAMVSKYRRLLMVEAELQRSSPSSEMVMIDRTFNQEERSTLTQDKRMVLVDPQLTSPPHSDTDSALEAAVNSILEC